MISTELPLIYARSAKLFIKTSPLIVVTPSDEINTEPSVTDNAGVIALLLPIVMSPVPESLTTILAIELSTDKLPSILIFPVSAIAANLESVTVTSPFLVPVALISMPFAPEI